MAESEPKSSDPLPSKTPTADRLRLGLAKPKPGVPGSKKINDPDLTREEFNVIAGEMFEEIYGSMKNSKG